MTAPVFEFGHLEIAEATARCDLPWVTPDAYLTVRTASEANAKFNEAMLAVSGKRQRAIVMGGATLTAKDAKEDRDDDKGLYPKFVITGWGGIKDKAGADVPFTVENCTAFIAALPNWIFDKIRVFCMRPENFTQSPADVPPDPAGLAKNS